MKNSGDQHLDQLLKDKLSDGSANVPGFVWDNIEAELFPKKKRRGIFWWFFGGTGIFLLVTFIAIGSYGKLPQQYKNNSKENKADTHNHAHTKSQKSAEISAENRSDSKENTTVRTADGRTVIKQDASYPENISSAGKSGNTALNGSAKGNFAGKTAHSGKGTKIKGLQGKKTPKTAPFVSGRTIAGGSATTGGGNAKTSRSTGTIGSGNSEIAAGARNPGEITGAADQVKEVPEAVKTAMVDTLPYLEAALDNEEQSPAPWKKPDEKPKPSFFSVGLYGGASFYDIAVFKDYFTSGQLSQRSFASSGFEAGINANFRLGDRLGVYGGIAFNRKKTMFSYNLAVTTEDYFTYAVNGEKIPLANIVDDGSNSCFLPDKMNAEYSINSTLLSAGGTYEFLRFGKFSAAADLRISMNIMSAMNLGEVTVIDIPQPDSEKFSYFQPGAGILLSYKISDRIAIGLSPFYSVQLRTKDSFYHKLNELVVPVTFRIGF